MNYAILSDIHANLEALREVLRDSKEQGCTHYAFLGDFVGYGPDPKACVDLVRSMKAPCVKGNFDEYCARDFAAEGFPPKTTNVIVWTRQQLTADDREWLHRLEYVRTVEDFTIVHAGLEGPEKWPYILDRTAAAASVKQQKTRLCFCGHTHVPLAFVMNGHIRGGSFTKFKVEADKKYLVNAGSVGQPRDNNPDAAYVIYAMDKGTIELRRLAYDLRETQRKMREAGLD